MTLSLLGPLQVDGDGQLSPRDRVVLSALAIRSGDVLTAEQLADALWGEYPPPSWPKIVQGCVARLRLSIGRQAIETTSGGYRLALADDEIDVRQFEVLIERARQQTATGEHDRAAALLAQALDLWRGTALPDLDRWPDGRTEATRLDELRLGAQEALLTERAAGGRDVVADATALVAAQPLRETRWWLLALALYRAGRQSDALSALRRARRTLQDELGLDPGQQLVELERAILNHDAGLAAPALPTSTDRGVCPYQGLVVYERGDSERFFGRDEETAACVRVLRDSSLLVVAGPSGSGKSSLVRAGVVPRLERTGRHVVVITPGTDPRGALAGAVAATGRDLVVVVDQLEELFTGRHDPDQVLEFLDSVPRLVQSGRGVVLVVRSDHVGGFSRSSAVARLVERCLHLVTSMTDADLRAAIVGPARQAGLRLEPGLVELLVRDVEGEPGALPLLSHALAETWERREAGVLTVEGYQATGGIRGAVAQSAERMWESLAPPQRATARALMLRLVTVMPDGEPAAARLPLSSVAGDPGREQLLDLLARCRLVTTDEASVTVAHEAVIRAWPRLRSWLDEDSAGLLTLRHLSVAVEDWDGRGRPDSELYRGPRLEAAMAWRERSAPALTPVEDAFLDAGAARARTEQDAVQARARQRVLQARRLRVALVATALGLVLALLAGTVALQRSRDASRTARDALIDKLAAQSVALRATQRDLAALLAVEAYRLRPEARTRSALLGVFTANPGFLGYLATGQGDQPGVPLQSGHVLSDGHLLAVGADGVIRVVDLGSGRTKARFPAPGSAPTAALIGVSQDESTVAELSWVGAETNGQATLGVYDVATRRRRVPDVLVPLDAGGVAVSPDGQYVAVSGYDDGRVLVYDTAGRHRLPVLSAVGASEPGVVALPPVGPAARLEAVQDYARGRTDRPLFSQGDPRLADPRLGPPGDANTSEQRYTAALAFARDGRLVVGSEVGIVRVVEPQDGHVVSRLTGAPWLTSNRAAVLSDDGSVLVTSGSRGVVAWDLRRNRPRWVADVGHGGENCSAAVIEPRSHSVLCGGRFSRVVSLNLDSGRQEPTGYDLQHGGISALLLSPDGRTLVQLSGSEGIVARWRLDVSGPITRSLPTDAMPIGYNSDGTLLLTGTTEQRNVQGHSVRDTTVVSAASGDVVWLGGDQVSSAWTDDPGQVVTWSPDDVGQVFDVRTGRPVRTLEGSFNGFPGDGRAVQAGSRHLLGWVLQDTSGGQVYVGVWDMRSGALRAVKASPVARDWSLSPDGRLLAVAGDEGLTTYDMSSSDDVASAPLATRKGIVAVALSAEGLVAASRADGRLAFYRAPMLEPLGPALKESPGEVAQLSFSQDGGILAVRSGTGALRLIDTATRTQLGEPIELGPDRTRMVALRPDGRELAVLTDNGIRVWDLRPASWARSVCTMMGRGLTRAEWATYLGEDRPYRPACA